LGPEDNFDPDRLLLGIVVDIFGLKLTVRYVKVIIFCEDGCYLIIRSADWTYYRESRDEINKPMSTKHQLHKNRPITPAPSGPAQGGRYLYAFSIDFAK
jgi:hypothetical protein